MKKKHFLYSLLLLLVVSFSGCDSNDTGTTSNQNDDAFAQNFGTAVSRDFIGQVVDTDNHPIQNAAITIGTATAQTDVNGVFIINGAEVHQKFAYITAKKTGFIEGSRALVPTSGKNNVRIMLIPNAPTATIQSGEASEVALANGTKVNFDGAFQDEEGVAYTGAVSVAMFHLLPSDENIDKLMPGMLYAQTATNSQAILATYGMLNVELRGAAGQKLNLAEGHTAEITMKIDDSQLATAPSSIPLWHFDTDKGYWKEDGVATKVGNNYVGEVSHFSWWNCDIPNSSILLTFTFVDGNGQPLSNLYINLVNQTGYHASGTTDSNGQLAGVLPANQALTLNVYVQGACGGLPVYDATVGPYASDTVVPTITITSSSVQTSQVTGTLLQCDGTAMANGYVSLNYNGHISLATVTNGTFSFTEPYCDNATAFTLQGFDYANLQDTGVINYNFTSPVTPIGVLTTCNTISEFISYQIDSNPTVIYLSNINAVGGIMGPQFSINGGGPAPTGFTLQGQTPVPGIYTTADYISIQGANIGSIGASTNNTVQFNISNFGNVGEYIDITFYGTYEDGITVGVMHTIMGTVHVLRDF